MGSSEKPNFKRSNFLVDRAFQIRMTLQLLSVLGGAAVLYGLALYVLPGSESLKSLDADETRAFFFTTNLTYFALTACILAVVNILLTHRIAGPARLIEQALTGMSEGQYNQRLTLRDGDYLRALAHAAEAVRGRMQKSDAALATLARCLDEQDLEGAREILAGLGIAATPKSVQPVAVPTT